MKLFVLHRGNKCLNALGDFLNLGVFRELTVDDALSKLVQLQVVGPAFVPLCESSSLFEFVLEMSMEVP